MRLGIVRELTPGESRGSHLRRTRRTSSRRPDTGSMSRLGRGRRSRTKSTRWREPRSPIRGHARLTPTSSPMFWALCLRSTPTSGRVDHLCLPLFEREPPPLAGAFGVSMYGVLDGDRRRREGRPADPDVDERDRGQPSPSDRGSLPLALSRGRGMLLRGATGTSARVAW